MGKRTLFVHMGIQRTATTSIQHFLKLNCLQLLSQGMLLPFKKGRHLHVVNRLFNGSLKPNDLAQRLNDFADSKANPVHSIILSDEGIALREQLTPFEAMQNYFNVKIVIALRRQDLWLESWYLQNVRVQWNKKLAHIKFDDFMKLANADYFHWIDYDRCLRRLEQGFGKENLLVSVFERDQMPQGPVMAFANSIGVDKNGFKGFEQKNASLSPTMTELCRQLPLDIARGDTKRAIGDSLISVDKELKKNAPESSRLLLTPDQRRAVQEHYASGNRAVAQRYFDRDCLFLDPLPPDDAPVGHLALPETTEEMMTRIMRPLMTELVVRLNERLDPL